MQARERAVGRVYWHRDGGTRYAHWFDGRSHWYGFYNGPRFYWTRYDDHRWWWYDEGMDRWLYWHDNYWWWNNPNAPGTPYVVVGENYYPYPAVAADPALAPGAVPADTPQAVSSEDDDSGEAPQYGGGESVVSPDGSREVQIYGERREAFLYDRSNGTPQFVAYLAPGVRKAQFSEASGDKLQVLLLLEDGTYDVFDGQGRSALQPDDSAPGAPQTPGADAVPADAQDPGQPPSDAPPIPEQNQP